MTIDYDQLALEVANNMAWRWNKETHKPADGMLCEFSRRYRAALKEKMEPEHEVILEHGTIKLYSLEDF